MNIGYASKTLALPAARMKSITAKHVTDDAIGTVIAYNLKALDATLEYCSANGIRLFRISSDVIPFGSSPVNNLDWASAFSSQLASLGKKAARLGIRLSMHPGQYTVLNSPNTEVACRAADDLLYHASFLDALKTGFDAKIVLHVGGLYGDRKGALDRFAERFALLDASVKNRLVIENDDRLFTAEDVLMLSRTCGIPMVFDVLHHQLNQHSNSKSDLTLINEANATWQQKDGCQKIHYSQQAYGKRPGSHSSTIELDEFLAFCTNLEERAPDIMLEVKDKNISAIKCITALDAKQKISALEQEWARYKYIVLEHDQSAYLKVRKLLNDKNSYPVQVFYRVIEQALLQPVALGSARNAIQHVWGYVSGHVTKQERSSFEKLLYRFEEGDIPLNTVKKRLETLSKRYGQDYLTHSYYFSL